MTRVAVIDCGTNTTRLLVADVFDGKVVEVVRTMAVTRLGEGVDRHRRLKVEAIARTTAVIEEYARASREAGAVAMRICATSAARDASNSEEFRARVAEGVGVVPDILPGEEEARASFLGATYDLEVPQPVCVFDIGGGSTEFVAGVDSRVLAERSLNVGCVRLTERHLRHDPASSEEVEALRAEARRLLAPLVADGRPFREARTYVGVAGTVTTLAAMHLRLPAYDPAAIHRSRLSAQAIGDLARRLAVSTQAERMKVPGMHPGRADVVVAGAVILVAIVDALGIGEVVVSETDILDGMALLLARDAT
ncbi:MAG: Ppx/GppA phosphatase family protein [Actinomycetota bacterium]